MKLIFVCEGNTCRSPMMEFAFKDYLELQYKNGIEAESRGISAEDGSLSPYAQTVLIAHGIAYSDGRTKRFTAEDYDGADVIIAVTDDIAKRLVENYGRNKIYRLSEIADAEIPDPCGKGLEEYERTYRKISASLPFILQFLEMNFNV